MKRIPRLSELHPTHAGRGNYLSELDRSNSWVQLIRVLQRVMAAD